MNIYFYTDKSSDRGDLEFFVQHHPNYKSYHPGMKLHKADGLIICIYLQLAPIADFCILADVAKRDWKHYQRIYKKYFRKINKNVNTDNGKNTYIFLPSIRSLFERENSKLLLYNSWETRDLFRCCGVLRHWCYEHQIPFHKVIFSTTDHKHIFRKSSQFPHISSYDWQYIRALRTFSPHNICDTDISKSKHILFMNNRCNRERFCTAAYLYSHYGGKSHISFMKNKRSEDISPQFIQYTQHFVSGPKLKDFMDKIPLTLDLGHPTKKYMDFLQESYIMLVFETNIVRSGVQQVSEKTYRPILAGMPFILWASQGGILSHLHSLGFKTFSPIINESYDDVRKSYAERYDILISELKRICTLSAEDMKDLYVQCLPMVKQNINILKNKRIQNFTF